MPDLPEDLAAMLRARADDAPVTPAPSGALVRSVRRRQGARLVAAVGGGTLGIVAVVVAAVAAVGPSSRHATPAAPPHESYPESVIVPPDYRYEFCPTGAAPAEVTVGTFSTELKYDKGCYVVAAGVPARLSFTNATKVAHNVVVAPDNGEPFAKTETVRAGGTSAAGYDTIELGTLARGDYQLTCDVHPSMHAQLIAR